MHNKEETPQEQHATSFSLLAKVSLSLYTISMLMPAVDNAPGMQILFVGLFFCWFVPTSWAYFANYAYFYIIVRYKSYPINAAILLLIFTFVTPLASFSSWGWGAIFWVVANFLMIADIYLRPKQISKTNEVKIAISILSIFLLPAIYLHITQHALATDTEKEKYLKFGTAFTTRPITGIEEVSPPKNLGLKKGQVVEIIGEISQSGFNVKDGEFFISLPRFYQQKNVFVQSFSAGYDKYVRIYSPPKPIDFYYGIKKSEEIDNLAMIFILDKNKNPVWQAPVALHKRSWSHKSKTLFPNELDYDFWDKVVDEIDYDNGRYLIQNRRLIAEKTNERCFFEKQKRLTNKAPNKIKWEDKIIEISPHHDLDTTFCSENYVFFVAADNNMSYVNIFMFDRASMLPLYYFRDYYKENKKDESVANLVSNDKNYSPIKSIAFTPYEYLKEDARITLETQNNGIMTVENDKIFD